MEPVILVTSLLLAAAASGDSPAGAQGQNPASSQPPARDAAPAQAQPPSRTPRTTSPPGSTPMPPMPNVDRGIQLPLGPLERPLTPGEPAAPDSARPGDQSVKPVPPAPSKPGEPGVRPLS